MTETDLRGRRVLVPRGGELGERLAEALRAEGAEPLVAPLIDAAPAPDRDAVARAAEALREGVVDWLVVTSATTVRELVAIGAAPAASTRIVAVGQATATALQRAGYPVHLVPDDRSAAGILRVWPGRPGELALLPQADIADPALAEGLRDRGAEVWAVPFYRTVAVEADPAVAALVASGGVDAILLTAGSVARQVARLDPPSGTRIVVIGPRTADAARAAGLRVDAVAAERDALALVRAAADALARDRGAAGGDGP